MARPRPDDMKTLWLEGLKPGDCFLVEWAHWDVQKYRVKENRPDVIVSNRWNQTKGEWASWLTVTSKRRLRLVTARPCEVDA